MDNKERTFWFISGVFIGFIGGLFLGIVGVLLGRIIL